MKNKILASLLAVCLFVGMAVPAFASTYSQQSGEPSDVTLVEFDKAEYTIAKDDVATDFAGKITAYASKKQMVLDAGITFELEGNNAGVFALSGTTVAAVEKSGTATIVAKNVDDKVVGKAKLVAGVAKPDKKPATGFQFAAKDYVVPTAAKATLVAAAEAAAEDFEIKVVATPAGTSFTSGNVTSINAAVEPAILKALGLYDDNRIVLTAASTDTGIIVLPLMDGTVIKSFDVVVAAATDAATANKATFVNSSGDGVLTLTTGWDTATSAVTAARYTAAQINTAIAGGGGTWANYKVTTPEAVSVVTVVAANTLKATATARTGAAADLVSGVLNADGNEITYKVKTANRDALLAADAAYISANKAVTVTATLDVNGDITNQRTTTARTTIRPVAGKVAIGISVPSEKTIEVGEVWKLGDAVKHVASDANIKATVSYDEDYLNTDATNYDYAIVATDGKVTGVAVGKNKIVSKIVFDGPTGPITKTAETIVTVVEKDSMPKPSDTKMTSTAHPKMVVGGTHNIKVTGTAADAKVEYKVLAGSESYVKVDDKGVVTALKATPAGTIAKVYVTVDGKDVSLYTNITTTDLPTTTDPVKPTTPPATGV